MSAAEITHVRHRIPRRRFALSAVLVVTLGFGGYAVHDYLFNAPFIQSGEGGSVVTAACQIGQPIEVGYGIGSSHDVQLTGAELDGVPGSVTVEGIYAVKMSDSPLTTVSPWRQQSWTGPNKTQVPLYPLTGLTIKASDQGGGWWLAARIVPHASGQLTIQGIRVFYKSGLRSGSAAYGGTVTLNCS